MVVYELAEAELIPVIEPVQPGLVLRVDIVENHTGNPVCHIRGFYRLRFNGSVYFLLLVRQEHINIAVFLHERLADKAVKRFLHPLGECSAVLVNIGNHEARDIIEVCPDLLDVLDHKQSFQHVYGKALFRMGGIERGIVKRLGDNALVRMVKELFQCVIEHIERNKRPWFLVHQPDGGFLEQRKHGTLTLCKMLSGRTMRSYGSQNAA